MATRGNRTDDAIAAIGAAIDGAADAPLLAQPGDQAPSGGRDEDDGPVKPAFPPSCPIACLGVLEQRCWYLDYNGQLVSLEMGTKHGKNNLAGLFGPKLSWLEASFPQWSKPVRERIDGKWEIVIESMPIPGTFDQAKASQALIIECARRGVFDPVGRIRGAGAHRGSEGGLVLHCGTKIMRRRLRINGAADEIEWHDTGLHGEHVYPQAGAIPRPWHEPVADGAGVAMLELLRKWRWKRPALDPLLVLGGIGASQLGGALDWRSNIWITGGKGTGKSMLNGKHGVLAELFGQGRVRSAEASAAYLRQKLRNATLPVFLDELEANVDTRRSNAILELARVSSSGDDAGRGGQDHQAVEFTLQSAFWASSILIPAMEPQDRSRWAICQLMPIPQGAAPIRPIMAALRLPELGRKLLRRMVDGWARWEATLAAYVDALSAIGHSARACDQFGTLLAAADLLLYDSPPDEETVAGYVALCGKAVLREVSESAEEHELCLNHLRTTMVQARGGDERESIGSWIGKTVQELVHPDVEGFEGLGEAKAGQQHRRLQELGLKLVARTDKGAEAWSSGKRGYLAIANAHQALAGMFAGTKWSGGVWSQALGYTPAAVDGIKIKFARSSLTATLVPLEAVIDESEVPASARWNDTQRGAE